MLIHFTLLIVFIYLFDVIIREYIPKDYHQESSCVLIRLYVTVSASIVVVYMK